MCDSPMSRQIQKVLFHNIVTIWLRYVLIKYGQQLQYIQHQTNLNMYHFSDFRNLPEKDPVEAKKHHQQCLAIMENVKKLRTF